MPETVPATLIDAAAALFAIISPGSVGAPGQPAPETDPGKRAGLNGLLADLDRREEGDPEALELASDALRGVLGILADGEFKPCANVAHVVDLIGKALMTLADMNAAIVFKKREEARRAAS